MKKAPVGALEMQPHAGSCDPPGFNCSPATATPPPSVGGVQVDVGQQKSLNRQRSSMKTRQEQKFAWK